MEALKRKVPRMFRSPQSAETGMIGLYMGLKEINLVQIDQQQGEGLSIRSAASVRYPLSRDEFLRSRQSGKKFFSDIFRTFGFKGMLPNLAVKN